MSAGELLIVACALLAATAFSVLLFRRLGLGSILGFLLVGIAVGPHTAGFVLTEDVSQLREFTELGVALLLFAVGLELQPRRLWAMRQRVLGLGVAQLAVTTALIAVAGALLLADVAASLLVGFALAISSTAIAVQILEDRGELATEHGRDAFAVLLLQDLAVIPVLAAVPLLAGRGGPEPTVAALRIVGVLGAVWVCGRWLVPLALGQSARARSLDAFSMFSLAAALGAAWATETAGGSLALGTFVMGMALSDSAYRHQVEVTLEPFKALLLGFFFVAVGMSIDVARVAANPLPTALGVAALVTLKIAVMIGLCAALGRSAPSRVRTAFLLAQGGEFGFALLGLAATHGLVATPFFEDGVLAIAASMLVTPLLVQLGDVLAARGGGAALAAIALPHQPHVIVAGHGRVGRAVCEMLAACDVPFVAFDRDPEVVALGRREGRAVHHGDLGDARALHAAGGARAAAIVVTLGDARAAERLVSIVRHFHPELPVIARARDLEARDRLRRDGASSAVPVVAESSLQLGAETLRTLRFAEDDVLRVLDAMREDDYARLRGPH